MIFFIFFMYLISVVLVLKLTHLFNITKKTHYLAVAVVKIKAVC